MNEPSLKCRCGGEYDRDNANCQWQAGEALRNYVRFRCKKCGRVLAAPLDREADLRFELQQMNLKLPDGWIDNQGIAWFAVADVTDPHFQRAFVSRQHNCLLISPMGDIHPTATDAIGSVISRPYAVNRSQAEPDPTFRPTPEMDDGKIPMCKHCGELMACCDPDYYYDFHCRNCDAYFTEDELSDAAEPEPPRCPECCYPLRKSGNRGLDYYCADCGAYFTEDDLSDAVNNDKLHRPDINDAFFQQEARGW